MRAAALPRSRSRLSPTSNVDEVVDAYLDAVDAGQERRELRAALSHLRSELGTMPVRAVRRRHLRALAEDLREAGLSAERQDDVADATRSLFGFADCRGLLEEDPSEAPPRAESPTPTLAMLAFGARLATLATWGIVLAFAVLAVALLLQLG